jgi:radical SAM protein with 4Fe4S-binding SPASM domain
MLSGLSQINIELSSKCNKATLCAFCGHQDQEVNHGLVFGDMDFTLLQSIRSQLDYGVVVQFHRDGEPTVYPRLRDALSLFTGFITSLVSHGEGLVKRADDIIGHCTSLTISVFRGDPDGPMQFRTVDSFLKLKGSQLPRVNIKIVGDMSDEEVAHWASLEVPILRRLIHVPDGNYKYARKLPQMPEHGICQDFLSHPSVDWRGNFYICNRLDPDSGGFLGSLRTETLDALWNSSQRLTWLDAHKRGRRDEAAPLCKDCKFYGVPSAA